MQVVKALVLLLAIPLLPAAAAEEGTLPRVLILGDSIYSQPAGEATKVLNGVAQVVHPRKEPGDVFNTTYALENLDTLLGEEKWDVIHFNCGLGDLVYRAPGMKAFRTLPIHAGGVRATDAQQYEKNLQELVKRLKATGAKLVWANTTPIRHSASNVFEMESEIEYNTIAAKVMAKENVPVNDMYSYAKSLIDMTKPAMALIRFSLAANRCILRSCKRSAMS